jgi:hypothetical protein
VCISCATTVCLGTMIQSHAWSNSIVTPHQRVTTVAALARVGCTIGVAIARALSASPHERDMFQGSALLSLLQRERRMITMFRIHTPTHKSSPIWYSLSYRDVCCLSCQGCCAGDHFSDPRESPRAVQAAARVRR